MKLNKPNISITDFTKICRICLISSDLLSISPEYLKLYRDLINLQTNENDRLPKNICKVCEKQLESTAYFIKICKENYLFLSLLLRKEKVERISPTCEIQDGISDEEEKIEVVNHDLSKLETTENGTAEADVSLITTEENDTKTKNFYCANCSKGFGTKAELVVHIKIHSESRPFSCQECNKKFKFRQSLQRHKLTHSGLKAYSCDICGKGFKRAFSRNKHRKIHSKLRVNQTNENKYSCTQCDRILTSRSALSIHMKTHTGEKPYFCSYCGKRFPYVNSLTIHTRLHTGETPFICSICNKGYRNSTGLKKHKEVKHFEMMNLKVKSEVENNRDDEDFSKNNDKRECKICHKMLHKCGFGTHMRIHTVEKKKFICTFCNKNFQKNSHLERHLRMHTGERPYICGLCGKPFKQDGDLKRHALTHTGEKHFQCQHCGKQYYTKGSLVNHMTIHTDIKKPINYECSICQKPSRQCGHSEAHSNREKPYLCTVCGKSFTASGTLKVHTRIHTGETPFVCSYCNKGYRNSTSLKSHVMRRHTGEKPHVCMVCHKGFHDSTNLKRHIKRVHSVEDQKR